MHCFFFYYYHNAQRGSRTVRILSSFNSSLFTIPLQRARPASPPVDARVQELASRLHDIPQTSEKAQAASEDGDQSDSELFAELEKDDELAGYREKRMEQLKAELS
jgi:hypothetical protein